MRLVTKNSNDYDEKFMDIKFNSDDELPLNKTIKIPTMATTFRTVFHENKKYYPKIFIDECFYKLKPSDKMSSKTKTFITILCCKYGIKKVLY